MIMNSFNQISIFAVVAILTVFVAESALSQTPAEQAVQNNTQIIQQFEQQRLQQERQQIIEREQDALKNNLDQPDPAIVDEGPCITINQIDVKGIITLKPQTIEPLLKNYQGRCLYISEINALTQEITNLYIERGYITSRAYVTAQDLSDGQLEILVVEGKLEGIRYEGREDKASIRELRTAFGDRSGEVLNLRDFEQGLDQMNRLQSNNVSMDLSPGEKMGSSVVQIKNKPTRRWHVETGIDNIGTESTGEEQGFINAQYDNILNLNDLISVSFKHDLIGANRRQSRNASFAYDVPYGYWNFSYSLNYFNYISEVTGGGIDFKTEGFSRVHTLGARRVIHRDQASKTNITTSLVARENENFIEGVKLDTSSQKLTLLNLGLSHSRSFDGAFIFVALNYTRGIGWLGAQEDDGLSAGDPQAEFDRLTADISAIKQWDFGWGDYNPRTDITMRGQWSRDQLFGSEQISVGGPSSVRGFKESSLSGDTGAYAVTQISIPVALSMKPRIQDYFGTFRPYLGFDAGVVRSDNANTNEGGAVRSCTAGIKNEGGKVDFELAYSKPISSPDFNDEESHDLFFRASIKF